MAGGEEPGEAEVTRAAAWAAAFAAPGEEVVAVLPTELGRRGRLYLCALRRAGDEEAPLAWVALDGDGAVVGDEAVVREAASLAALCETAEEAAAVLVADEIATTAERALAFDGLPDGLAGALAATADAARELGRVSEGVRVARAPYLDEVAERQRGLGAAGARLDAEAKALTGRLTGEPGDPAEPLARAVWEVVGLVAGAGSSERFTQAIEAAAPAVDALVADVVASLRRPEDDGEEAHG